jgi:hypothetical protein
MNRPGPTVRAPLAARRIDRAIAADLCNMADSDSSPVLDRRWRSSALTIVPPVFLVLEGSLLQAVFVGCGRSSY